MYRVLVSRQVASQQVARTARRRLATDSAPEPKKKTHIFRKIIWTTTAAAGTFYVGSSFVAFNNQAYYDFFSDRVPLGQSMLEFAEARSWDTLTLNDVMDAGKNAVIITRQFIENTISGKAPPQDTDQAKAAPSAQPAVVIKLVDVPRIQTNPPTSASKLGNEKKEKVEGGQRPTFSGDVQALVNEAETVLAKDTLVPASPSTIEPAPVQETIAQKNPAESNLYDIPLPIGFEPPPGYKRPSPEKPKPVESKPAEPKPTETQLAPVELPLVAPSVQALAETEPIINHLAGTIDNLATFVAVNPAAASKAADVLEGAKVELTSLVEHIEKVREDERSALEAKMDEQTREYSLKLIELEMEAQDKLDNQEEEFRRFFEEERAKMTEAYREKLDQELNTQMEIINERLKQEVIAQGIELQRRWIREIKVRVEQERGGRLSKLEELSAKMKRLEQIALGNAEILDNTTRVHALWSAARALSASTLESPDRKPFRDELRVLRHIAAARDDELVTVVLDSLEASDVPDIGVEPLSDLTTWFTTSVSPKVARVALVPDRNAGVLSYLASHVVSAFRFKRHGLVEGGDVLSVLARAEYYLNEKDLDSAARELNQLKGPAKALLHDWLEAVCRRLEVAQALNVVQVQATVSSLLTL